MILQIPLGFLSFFFFLEIGFIYLFLAMLGVRCCLGSSLFAVCGLLIAVASPAGEHGL